MPNKDYYPKAEGDLIPWLDNYYTKLGIHATALDIPAAVVTQVQADLASAEQQLKNVAAAKNTWQAAVNAKDDVLGQVQKHVRDRVVIIKRHDNYTDTIGLDLGIIGPSQGQLSADVLTNAKPDFTATVLPDMVRLDWTKGAFDGVIIQSKRGADTNFTAVDKDTISPYEDDRGNLTKDVPETRTYRMRYLYGDDEVGVWSDEVKVMCLL